jgi:hypothetical protein
MTRSKLERAAFCKCFMGKDFATVAHESVLKQGAFGFDMYHSGSIDPHVFHVHHRWRQKTALDGSRAAAWLWEVNPAPAHWRISCFVNALLRKLRAVYERFRLEKFAE